MSAPDTKDLLAPLRTPSGGFAMVALDQRESLREMFPVTSTGELVDDVTLREFKRTAAGILSPLATGVLLDRPLAVTEPRRPDYIAPGCGLILAADILHSTRGEGVGSTSLDSLVDADFVRGSGAVAVKFLLIWRRGQSAQNRDLLDGFLGLAREAGVASFVEGIVRPAPGASWIDDADRHAAILEAADEMHVGADVYKGEVPGYVRGDLSLVEDAARQLSAIVDGPWVVLSNGVHQPDFADAVRLSCAGGAHGFLAGRAIWADTVAERDYAAAIADRSTQRLRELSAIVESAREAAHA